MGLVNIKVFRSRAAEMTVPVIIAIVLGLIIVALLFFAVRNKTNSLGEAGNCEAAYCSANPAVGANCEQLSGYTKSLTLPCKFGEGDDQRSGRCCIQE